MRIGLGVSDFAHMRQEDLYYIDKSLLIRDLIEDGSQAVLLPRPRRFGKTLNLSMLRYYFERPLPGQEAAHEGRWALFQDLAIAQAGDRYRTHFARYPVIHLSFKDIKDLSWQECRESTAKLLARLYGEHEYLLPQLRPVEAQSFQAILEQRGKSAQLGNSLYDLCSHLAKHHGHKVVALLDEYDTPLHTAHLQGYYEEALGLYRTLYSALLKDNAYLHKGVMTGVLRVAKDNIFTGLNNIAVYSILQKQMATAFGFTQEEVETLLRDAGLSDRLQEVQRWYNGYLFGEQVIYNPWSVLCYANERPDRPRSYWASTSSNDLVKTLLLEQGNAAKDTWEALLRGESIEGPLEEHVALRDLKQEPDLLWSLLCFSGYLKVVGWRQLADESALYKLAVPNREVLSIYREQFASWMKQGLGGGDQRKEFLGALLAGDEETVERLLGGWLMRHASYHDTAQGQEPERFYHGLVLGLLVSMGEDYEVRSNPESGYGRCDLLISPRKPGKPGVVLELKVASRKKKETLAQALRTAKQQLRERGYAEALRDKGAEPVHQLAVAWQGKEVLVEKLGPGRAGKQTKAKRKPPAGKRGR